MTGTIRGRGQRSLQQCYELMDEREFRRYESRLRQAVKKQGYRLEKSRTRNYRSPDFGTYRIVDPDTGFPAAGGYPTDYGLSVGDVVDWINEADR